jgi:hypothetical protein
VRKAIFHGFPRDQRGDTFASLHESMCLMVLWVVGATDHTSLNPWMQERLFVGGLIWQLSRFATLR